MFSNKHREILKCTYLINIIIWERLLLTLEVPYFVNLVLAHLFAIRRKRESYFLKIALGTRLLFCKDFVDISHENASFDVLEDSLWLDFVYFGF